MQHHELTEIDAIRTASRVIVRELGFLEKTLAGTGLPPSAVHAIVEIGQGTVSTATELTSLLGLEKSSVSRMVKGLISQNLIAATPSPNDARQQNLLLTQEGIAAFDAITAFGQKQVRSALDGLSKRHRQVVQQGLETYASALLPKKKPTADQLDIPNTVKLISGYIPTVVGRVTALHANYYAKTYGFGVVFESKVAAEMSEFLSRIDHPDNEIWSATLAGQIVGSVSIDGQDLGSGKAHLRWFIVDDCARGYGVGKRLMSAAMQFVNERQFKETHLWTFKGLEAARSLYEREGFSLIRESAGKQWGTEVLEQQFIRSSVG